METYLTINLDAIKENVIKIKELNKNSMFCAVVKANAYGLGSVEIAQYIENGVDYFAVAKVSEALILRKNGIKKPIIILGYVSYKDVDLCTKHKIDIPIYDIEYAKKINSNLNNKINVHIALDTGHSRIGFRDYELDKIRELKNLKNINVISAFSHYASADEEDESFMDLQAKRYDNIINQIKNDFNFKFLHLSNSAGALKQKTVKDMVRVGIAIYGIYPSIYLRENSNIDLIQCFSLKSKVTFVKNIKKGTPISYGSTFISPNEMKVATVAIGYADGFFRAFSNVGELRIKDKNCKVLGRVCMDQLMVDVSDLDVKIDDEVIIYPDIYKEAEKISTITYELMTSVSMRVPRVYMKNNSVIKIVDYLGISNEN